MSAAIDSIWDVPLEDASSRSRSQALASNTNSPARPSPSKKRRTALFYPSDSENDAPVVPYRKRTPTQLQSEKDKHKAAVDALFDDLDDFDDPGAVAELAPSLDIDQLRKQAESRQRAKIPALTPHQILPSSSPPRDLGPDEDADTGARGSKGKKGEKGDGLHKRKPIPKLDETRLLGPNGFPALIKATKNFHPKGKGKEVCKPPRTLVPLNQMLRLAAFRRH